MFNYTDCAEQPERYTEFTINWFATKTGNRKFLSENKFSKTATEIGKISRLAGAGIVWTAQFVEKKTEDIPMAWKGDGANPIVIFTGSENDPNGFYFSGKGGRGTVNHGNMDGGSFIFELNGVSWAIDPGNQSYGVLERAKFKLWGRCQECDRWELITKSNFGHSTLSVSNQLHVVDGLATIADFQKGDKPEVTIDMTATFQGQLKSAKRRFLKESSTSIIIEDNIEISEETKLITWQLITTADVIVVQGGPILKQDGKQFRLENLSHPDIVVLVISLDPAPLALDKQIEGLKRLEIRIPVWIIENDKTKISVRLSEG
ncbi:MAG: hypothetical protein ACI959_001594 [Limisphaerales bacterium]